MAFHGLEADALARHQHFLDQVVQTGQVWSLQGAQGWVRSSSTRDETSGAPVAPFWSARAAAAACAREAWSDAEPAPIPLNQFLIAWLTGMHFEGTLVGTEWNAHLVGQESRPDSLQLQLIDALDPQARAAFDEELAWVRSEYGNPDYEVLPAETLQGKGSVAMYSRARAEGTTDAVVFAEGPEATGRRMELGRSADTTTPSLALDGAAPLEGVVRELVLRPTWLQIELTEAGAAALERRSIKVAFAMPDETLASLRDLLAWILRDTDAFVDETGPPAP